MAGSKTRFGFLGSGEEPPDSNEPGSTRTVIGHDIHLQDLPSGFSSPPMPPETPAPAAPVEMPKRNPHRPFPSPLMASLTEAVTESIPVRRPYPPRKSRLGRMLGRWTTSGRFQSQGQVEDASVRTEEGDLEVPRDTTGRNVLLVLTIAALTFLAISALVKLRRHWSAQPAAQSVTVATPANETTAQPPAPSIPPQTAPAPSQGLPVEAAAKPALLGATAPALPTPIAKNRPPLHKTAPAANPAVVPPEHLKDELLPLTR